METTDNQPDNAPGKFRKARVNQIVMVEYEIPTDDGHKITVLDSYRNILGRIYEKYDTEKGHLEYTFCNHEDKPQFFSGDLKELKAQIFRNKTVLLEQAHERRLEMKGRRIELAKEPMSIAPFGFKRKTKKVEKVQEKTVGKTPPQKSTEKPVLEKQAPKEIEKDSIERQREQELEELRESQEHNREQELER